MTAHEILNLPMRENDAGAATIRDYFRELLKAVLGEKEGFSGKRPFGNSSWEYDLYEALAKGGALKATFGEDGYLLNFNQKEADRLLSMAAVML